MNSASGDPVARRTSTPSTRFRSWERRFWGDGELFAIYLDPALQRKGIGRALWQASSAWLQSAGFEAFRLWCIDGNAAEAFYRAMGAQCVAHRNFDAHGGQLGENCYRAATRESC